MVRKKERCIVYRSFFFTHILSSPGFDIIKEKMKFFSITNDRKLNTAGGMKNVI